jgi:cytosine/adenosine deaminase-related metal-dependent hydrolase
MTSILLQNGTVLLHGEDDRVKAVELSLLIQGNKIAKIDKDISVETSTEVIDCTGKIISPGFIDTHHHLWQTQLKGRHANEVLLEYMVTGNWQSSNFSSADFFWGQLGGCLEAVCAGTTTVVDHAHLNYSPESSKFAISATVSSGIRSIFGYCPTLKVTSWNPVEFDYQVLAPWVLETFTELGLAAPFGENGRVTLGLAFDLYFLPKDVIISLFSKAKELGVKTITSHFCINAQFSKSSLPALLDSYGLLDDSILLSHSTGATAEDAALLKKTNAHISSTPSTELQMALGAPVCFRNDMKSQSSLGIDCHAFTTASIPMEMRLGLQSARVLYNDQFIVKGKAPRRVNNTVEEAFNLGTIQGARAIKMENLVGSLAIGKLADLVIFDATSPAMVCGAAHDPVAAIVLHSSPADVEAVMVDGVWRKRGGKLLPVQVEQDAQQIAKKEILEWSDVARELIESRKKIQDKVESLDFDEARTKLIATFQIDEADILEKL